jgi:hypothetical protein
MEARKEDAKGNTVRKKSRLEGREARRKGRKEGREDAPSGGRELVVRAWEGTFVQRI